MIDMYVNLNTDCPNCRIKLISYDMGNNHVYRRCDKCGYEYSR